MTKEIESPCIECDMQPISEIYKCQLFDACKAMTAYQHEKKAVSKISNVELALMHCEELFEIYFKTVQECVHQTAEDKGQWEGAMPSDVLLHIHDEVSELWKEIGNVDLSESIPDFSKREEEAADGVLMYMSLAEELGLDLAGAIVAKAKYNLTRGKT